MKTTIFQSFLATFFNQFVQYKRALNRKYDTDAEILRLLDRYLQNVRITEWQTIDGSVIDKFIRSRPRVSACSYNQLLGVLRRFFNFAVMQEWIQSSPVTATPRRITGTRIPYLFDLATARRLLAVARSLSEGPRTRHRGLVYETVFALLYGLGLRVGEVARLKLADADLIQNTLLIRDTKFGKTRIVPLGPNLAQRLKRYVTASWYLPRSRTIAVLLYKTGFHEHDGHQYDLPCSRAQTGAACSARRVVPETP